MDLMHNLTLQLIFTFVAGTSFGFLLLYAYHLVRGWYRRRKYSKPEYFTRTEEMYRRHQEKLKLPSTDHPVNDAQIDYLDIPVFLRRQPAPQKVDTADLQTAQSIQQELDELSNGIILFNPPSVVTVGNSERVEVRIAKKPLLAMLENLKGRGVKKTEEIKVSDLMSVSLAGPAFLINSRSSEQQLIADNDYTEWSWDIVPLTSGTQYLTLHVSAVIILPGIKERKDLPVLEKSILVRSNLRYSMNEFGAKNWQWIAGTILIPIVVYLWTQLK